MIDYSEWARVWREVNYRGTGEEFWIPRMLRDFHVYVKSLDPPIGLLAEPPWYCFDCDKIVGESHIVNVCDRGAQTGSCKSMTRP